jgi:tetraacyldisaccharide 4'-kinase
LVAAAEEGGTVGAINEAVFRDLISGKKRGWIPAIARCLLRVASVPYGWAAVIRSGLYDCGVLPTYRVGVPVISVGNLTAGGTGKTPVAALLCQRLALLGCRPGLISRGYRAAADGSNDEKRVLELLVPGTPHIQQPDRVAAARKLLDMQPGRSPDVIVMDDGFQHRRLQRDLNLVLIDATCPFGFGAILPRGLLREPLRALRRADAVLLTRANLVAEDQLQVIRQRLLEIAPALNGRILQVSFLPQGFRDVAGNRRALSELRGQPIFLMTAIGNPEAFLATCLQAGLTVVGHRWFPDHHHYTAADLAAVLGEAQANLAGNVMTTLKDLVKIRDCRERFLALDIEATFPRPEDNRCFDEILQRMAVRT